MTTFERRGYVLGALTLAALLACTEEDDRPPPPQMAAPVLAPAPVAFGVIVIASGSAQLVHPETGAVVPVHGLAGQAPQRMLSLAGGEGYLAESAGSGSLLHGRLRAGQPQAQVLPTNVAALRVVAADATASAIVLSRASGPGYAVTYELVRGGSQRPLIDVAYPGGAAVSSDGSLVVVSGTRSPCTDLPRCPMYLWTVDAAGALTRVQTREDRASYKPQILEEAGRRWLLWQTTANDDSPECATNLNRCRHDIVRRPVAGGADELIARGAIAFAAGPGGRRAWLSHDGEGCTDVTCATMRLHLVDPRGARVLDERAGSVLPDAFSPDGRWLAYRDRVNDTTKIVDLITFEVRTLTPGFPFGWLRMIPQP